MASPVVSLPGRIMNPSRFCRPRFLLSVAVLVLFLSAVMLLAMTYGFREYWAYRAVAWTAFSVFTTGYLVACGLALRDLGHSAWLAASGLVMGLIPLILYAVLPDRSSVPGLD